MENSNMDWFLVKFKRHYDKENGMPAWFNLKAIVQANCTSGARLAVVRHWNGDVLTIDSVVRKKWIKIDGIQQQKEEWNNINKCDHMVEKEKPVPYDYTQQAGENFYEK